MTLVELRTWVRRQTLITTAELADLALNSILGQALLDAASRYQWPWAYTTVTIPLVDGTTSYDLPDDIMFLDELVYVGQGPTRLARTSIQAVTAEFGAEVGDSDLPDRYYLDAAGAEITFVPTPDAAQDITAYYFATPDLDDFDADGDSPPFHAAFHLALAEYATAKVWDQYEQEDKGGFYMQMYLDTLNRMAIFYDLRLPAQPFVVGGGMGRERLRHLDGYLGG